MCRSNTSRIGRVRNCEERMKKERTTENCIKMKLMWNKRWTQCWYVCAQLSRTMAIHKESCKRRRNIGSGLYTHVHVLKWTLTKLVDFLSPSFHLNRPSTDDFTESEKFKHNIKENWRKLQRAREICEKSVYLNRVSFFLQRLNWFDFCVKIEKNRMNFMLIHIYCGSCEKRRKM